MSLHDLKEHVWCSLAVVCISVPHFRRRLGSEEQAWCCRGRVASDKKDDVVDNFVFVETASALLWFGFVAVIP